jgi:hypothetical protein
MQKHIMVAQEAFAGTTVYSTRVAEELHETWIKVYEVNVLAAALNGMLFGYQKKKLHKGPLWENDEEACMRSSIPCARYRLHGVDLSPRKE